MSGLTLLLVSLFVAKLVAGGLAGEAARGRRRWAAVGSGTLIALAGSFPVRLSWFEVTPFVAAALTSWHFVRRPTDRAVEGSGGSLNLDPRLDPRAVISLTVLGAFVGLAILLGA